MVAKHPHSALLETPEGSCLARIRGCSASFKSPLVNVINTIALAGFFRRGIHPYAMSKSRCPEGLPLIIMGRGTWPIEARQVEREWVLGLTL